MILFFQSGHAVDTKYYTPWIAKAGAKSETEIITIFTNFSFVSYDTDDGILNVSLLDLDLCLEYLTFFRVLRYIFALLF